MDVDSSRFLDPVPWRIEQPTKEECFSSRKAVDGSHTVAATISSVPEREFDALADMGRQEKYQLDNTNQSSICPSDQSCAKDLDWRKDLEQILLGMPARSHAQLVREVTGFYPAKPNAPAEIGRQDKYQSDNRNQSSISPSDQSRGFDLDWKKDMEQRLRFQPTIYSRAELMKEVTEIYSGLNMLESKCKEIEEKQAQSILENDTMVPNLAKSLWFRQDKSATYPADASPRRLHVAHTSNYTNYPTTSKRLLASAIRTVSKVKRGLSGFVNGARLSAFPDTGSSRNVVSEHFAKELKLEIENSPQIFMLGNSTLTKSLGELISPSVTLTLLLMIDHTGTVCLDWAFSEAPKDVMKIVCDVLPNCSYKLILGSSFLTKTQTLSRYRHRLTECVFSIANILTFNFIGNECQRLQGHVGDHGEELLGVLAVPDTGAEANIMDERYGLLALDYHHQKKIAEGDQK